MKNSELYDIIVKKNFKYPNGDELCRVAVFYLANNVTGNLKITDGESFELKYFSKKMNYPSLKAEQK